MLQLLERSTVTGSKMMKKRALDDVLLLMEQEWPPLLDLVPMMAEALGNDPKLIQAFALGMIPPPELRDTLPKDPRDVH